MIPGHRPLVVGNWKMNTTRDEANTLTRSLGPALEPLTSRIDVVVCPPYPWLVEASANLAGSAIALGAQNMHAELNGAYTGEVSPRMLRGLVQWVLVGQYERRIYFAERDAMVKRKLQVARKEGLRPILCVGENADQMEEGLGPYVVAEQLEANLDGVELDADLVVAYDPAWTTMGLVAPPPLSYAEEIARHIRDTISDLFVPGLGDQIRVLYGGSVTPRNIAEIAALPSVDGVLAGTASTNAANFTSLVQAYAGQLPPTG
jgi:triosephosphate isomerase